MSSHSRKPKWAEGAERISWAHCRRPGCGAKPYVPSKADPALCQECADYYTERGRKYCRGCDRWLHASMFSTGKAQCKPCRAARQRERDRANTERRHAYSVARYAANRERLQAAAREWRQKNAERVRAYRRAYHAANGERTRAHNRAAYWKDPEKHRAYGRQYNRMKRRAFGRAR